MSKWDTEKIGAALEEGEVEAVAVVADPHVVLLHLGDERFDQSLFMEGAAVHLIVAENKWSY